MTDPFCLRAAKADVVAYICTTSSAAVSPSIAAAIELLSPPSELLPQVTTLPSVFMAANAEPVAEMSVTFFSLADTELESPPNDEYPQESTLPSVLRAANADRLEYISFTPLSKLGARFFVPSPPVLFAPQVITEPSFLRAAKEF